jgi:hypothetical protein
MAACFDADIACHGLAAYAVYESGLKVPEDLLLILHRNVELDYCCPFPALYLDTRLSMIAERLANAVTNTPEK